MSLIAWQKIPVQDSGEPLVDLGSYGFLLEPVYFNQGLSKEKGMFLRKSVAEKLARVQRSLQVYRLKVWDGFRSREVQDNLYQKYWNEFQSQHPEWDENRLRQEVGVFVTPAADPGRIPPHATGGAVDLTLADLDGRELDMGTPFDYFGPEGAPYYFERNSQNETAKNNRKILREAMFAEDFCIDELEWWHFDYGSQKWAVQMEKPYAILGEAKTPE
jgi:D-alanyl-D-alanine dipeptidase